MFVFGKKMLVTKKLTYLFRSISITAFSLFILVQGFSTKFLKFGCSLKQPVVLAICNQDLQHFSQAVNLRLNFTNSRVRIPGWFVHRQFLLMLIFDQGTSCASRNPHKASSFRQKKLPLNGVKIERSHFTVCPKFFNAGDRFAASSLHRNRPDTRSRDESPCPSRHQSRVFRKKERKRATILICDDKNSNSPKNQFAANLSKFRIFRK